MKQTVSSFEAGSYSASAEEFFFATQNLEEIENLMP